MTDETKKTDEATVPDTVETVAEAVDNPAQTTLKAVEQAAEGAKEITPEKVEEVIDEHAPPANPLAQGLDAINAKLDQIFTNQTAINERLDAMSKPAEPKKEEKSDAAQAQPQTKPARRKIKLLRGSRSK